VELYDDRLEIKSPGHLPEHLDVSKIEATVLVNPVIAAIFHLYKHIERAGTGIQVAQRSLHAQGLPPARIENIEHPNMVKVTVYRAERVSAQPGTEHWLARWINQIFSPPTSAQIP
ncbi:MAG TPA: ATP-binding protein, partial [Saprospiraceae bacterium]|nr:ATP-binding protein [Saprospiraceae bacterium]